MHVGWVSRFSPPAEGRVPSFEQLREHIEARLPRAPRYRQRLESLPLDLATPSWVDDEAFDISHHVVRADQHDLMEVAAEAMSRPLPQDRPLWEITLVEGLEDGGVGIVGKAHHCMVDGVAAVELAALLLDGEPDPVAPPEDSWSAQPVPGQGELVGRRVLSGLGSRVRFLGGSLDALRSPQRLTALPDRLEGLARAAMDTVRPARPAGQVEALNEELSTERHLGATTRSLSEIRAIKDAFGTTVNDVLLAAVAGALRDYLIDGGSEPGRLKTMVPVNVRAPGETGGPGNRISFMFVDLPCEEPDSLRRLHLLAAQTVDRKRGDLPFASERILDAIGQIPHAVRGVASRFVASPRFFNLTVSNIPGPPGAMYMCGCRMEGAYPIVPLPERHALSVGMTTIGDAACFGLYADRRAIPDVGAIAAGLDRELDRLLAEAG